MRRTLLAVALTASLVNATPTGLLHPLWTFLASFWNAPADLKEGCGFDPSGRCLPAQPQLDAGCGFDPSGHCNPGS